MMNKELEEMIIEAGDNAVVLVDTIKEQSPILLDEILRFELIKSILYLLIPIAIAIFLYIVDRAAQKDLILDLEKYEENPSHVNKDAVDFCKGFILAIKACYLIPIIISVVLLLDIIKILVAPRLYLLEYFTIIQEILLVNNISKTTIPYLNKKKTI